MALYPISSATTSSGRAPLSSMIAAPGFLGHTPACHPVRKASVAVVRQRRGPTTTCCWWATLSMHLAAPGLLADRPAGLPICKTVCTIVRVCWPHWLRWQDWHNDWGSSRHLRGTAFVVDPTTPSTLLWRPRRFGINSAIERITGWHWSDWSHRWRRGGCRCWEWCWWHSDRQRLRASCGRPGCATSANCGAAKILLLH